MIKDTYACCNCFRTERHPEYYGWSRWGARWVCVDCLNSGPGVWEPWAKETQPAHVWENYLLRQEANR